MIFCIVKNSSSKLEEVAHQRCDGGVCQSFIFKLSSFISKSTLPPPDGYSLYLRGRILFIHLSPPSLQRWAREVSTIKTKETRPKTRNPSLKREGFLLIGYFGNIPCTTTIFSLTKTYCRAYSGRVGLSIWVSLQRLGDARRHRNSSVRDMSPYPSCLRHQRVDSRLRCAL